MNENDLVQRLRRLNEWGDKVQHVICDEAADLIERQSARIEELEGVVREQAMQYLALDGQAANLLDDRAAIVRWLRGVDKSESPADLADAIERGDHQRLEVIND